MASSELLKQIQAGKKLKKATTNDRSAPQLDAPKGPGGGGGRAGLGGGGGGPSLASSGGSSLGAAMAGASKSLACCQGSKTKVDMKLDCKPHYTQG